MSDQSYFAYNGRDGSQISFPMGGIGAGCIGLSASGRLIDWEIANHPDKGSTNGFSHFAIRAEAGGKTIDTRILNGPFNGTLAGDRGAGNYREFGWGVRREYLAGLPHFRGCDFQAFFPAAELTFEDPAFPGKVEMLAYSPFIPMDEKSSSLPVALFEFAVSNPTDKPIRYSLVGCIGNPFKGPHGSRLERTDGRTAMVNFAREVAPETREFGELMIVTDSPDVSWQHEWYRGSWFDSLEIYWKDLIAPGPLRDRVYTDRHVDRRLGMGGGGKYRGHSLLAAHETIEPGERAVIRFALVWYAPNFERDWLNIYGYAEEPKDLGRTWKNHYATVWSGVEDVAAHTFSNWDRIRSTTLKFRDTLRATTLPASVLDAVSANLSILITPTMLRLEDGTLYGWEGCDVTSGSCEGSCTHVWNYQQAVPFLFPALERGMRAADFTHNLDPVTGAMSFRLCLPLGMGRLDMRPCADGQFGNVMKAYRDWKISGDDAWLAAQWPAIKKAVEFAWHPDNHDRWDPARFGVLWGRQHHTLDMELFGPNSWLTGFYLGALRAAEQMARHLGETATADEYAAIFAKGKSWIDENLFNGSYFVQKFDISNSKLLTPYEGGPDSPVLKGSIRDLYWSDEYHEIKYQLTDGCLIDQVIGQWHADLYGLGDLFDRAKIASTLQAIFKHNYYGRLGDVANPCRVFGLEEESGTIICAWPEGTRRPVFPVPYSQETFHGMEYAFGSMLMQAGEVAKGVQVFRAVRDRYRGHNRNPWNEMECGSNYARSMASYAGLLSLSGFAYDLPAHRIAFSPLVKGGEEFRSFWSAADAWGEVVIDDAGLGLTILFGAVDLERIGLPASSGEIKNATVTLNAKPVQASVDAKTGDVSFKTVSLRAGDRLAVQAPGLAISRLPDIAGL